MTRASFLRPIAIATVALALSACANDRVWMRNGASSSDGEIDEMNCAEQAEKGGVSVSVGGDVAPTTDRFSNRYACLRSQGYKLKSLTAEETSRLKSLGGVDREVYWNELLAKYGFSPAAEKRDPAVPQAAMPPQAPKPATPQ